MEKIIKIVLITGLILIAGLYFTFIFILPVVLNSANVQNKIKAYTCKQTGICVEIKNLKIKTSPFLYLYLTADEIKTEKEISIKDLYISADLKSLSLNNIEAEHIFIDGNEIQKMLPKKKSGKKSDFNINKLPKVSVKKVEYISDIADFNLEDIVFDGHNADFNAEGVLPFLQNSIKAEGHIEMSKGTLSSRNSKFFLCGAELEITGKLTDKKKRYDLKVMGENLPVDEIEKALLYYQKSQDPAKKFIENFTNYSGKIDMDLNIKNDGIFGQCIAKKLGASAVWFKIPVYFENAVFDFNGDNITSTAYGLLGGEEVKHILDITNLGSHEKEVVGTLTTALHEKFHYIPDLKILNQADAKITYKIKQKKINVEYSLNLEEGSDLIYKNAYLGLRDKQRYFFFETLKDGNSMYIPQFNYSLISNDDKENIISGNGLLVKENDHMLPQYFTCKTNGYAPVSVTGSFGEYVDGGEFSGDLKYDFRKNKIAGNFELINTKFKNFYVSKVMINSDDENIRLKADGTYSNEKFLCDIEAKNDFGKSILIYKMNMFLNALILQKSESDIDFNPKNTEIASRIKDSDITIENWKIKIGKIQKDRIIFDKIELLGSLKDDTFKFSMPELKFAQGILSASGWYNFADYSSDIDFNATDINSNTAADMIFNLPNQVNGIANAKLHLNTSDKLEDIKASADFEIKEGFLPQFGNTEFRIKKSRKPKKFKVSEITNIDFTGKKELQSDIKGSLYLNNSLVEDINLTSRQKYLSLFLEGNYDTESQYAEINLFGKYNKEAPKGVKILFIPLNWILNAVLRYENSMDLYKEKLEKIPPVDSAESTYFRVKFNGELNNKKPKVEFKRIK